MAKESLKRNRINETPVILPLLLMLTGVGKPLLLLSKLRRMVVGRFPRTATVTVVALPNAPQAGLQPIGASFFENHLVKKMKKEKSLKIRCR